MEGSRVIGCGYGCVYSCILFVYSIQLYPFMLAETGLITQSEALESLRNVQPIASEMDPCLYWLVKSC